MEAERAYGRLAATDPKLAPVQSLQNVQAFQRRVRAAQAEHAVGAAADDAARAERLAVELDEVHEWWETWQYYINESLSVSPLMTVPPPEVADLRDLEDALALRLEGRTLLAEGRTEEGMAALRRALAAYEALAASPRRVRFPLTVPPAIARLRAALAD